MKKVKTGGMYLVGLWKEHMGLMALLIVGGVILVLAAMGSGAWAAPNQSGLRQTVPQGDVVATDENGVEKNLFRADESVSVNVRNNTFTPGSLVDVYVVADAAWTIGDPIPTDVGNGVDTVAVNANGAFGPPPPVVWPAPLTPGRYDLVFDANQDAVFNTGDGVDDAVLGTGFVVQAAPIPVGGVAILPNGSKLLAPRIGLAALMGVVVAAVVVMLRRQGKAEA